MSNVDIYSRTRIFVSFDTSLEQQARFLKELDKKMTVTFLAECAYKFHCLRAFVLVRIQRRNKTELHRLTVSKKTFP